MCVFIRLRVKMTSSASYHLVDHALQSYPLSSSTIGFLIYAVLYASRNADGGVVNSYLYWALSSMIGRSIFRTLRKMTSRYRKTRRAVTEKKKSLPRKGFEPTIIDRFYIYLYRFIDSAKWQSINQSIYGH